MDSNVQNTELGSVIHCGNLSMKTTYPELFSLFSQVAPVLKIVLRKDEIDLLSKKYIDSLKYLSVPLNLINKKKKHTYIR